MNQQYQNLLTQTLETIENNAGLINNVRTFLEKKISNVQLREFDKLVKQVAYDILVLKRREYDNDTLEPCANPAHYPEKNSPFDTREHIDCLSAWTQNYEFLELEGIKFKYLKNLDATYVIMGKDSTGKVTHLKSIEKLDNYENYKEKIRAYVNRESNENPFQDAKRAYILDEFRFGFSPKGVKTSTMLRKLTNAYLHEKISVTNEGAIIPIANENIFLINCFVFLSAEEKTSSFVPDHLFKMSVDEFILPLLEVIKPKIVIQGGMDAAIHSLEGTLRYIQKSDTLKMLNPNFYINHYDSYTAMLTALHTKLIDTTVDLKKVLSTIQWNENECTYFIPVNHPSRSQYYYKENKRQGHLVWNYIKHLEF